MTDKTDASPSRPVRTRGNVISVDITLPEPGETATLEIPRYNLTILVERGAAETQEQLRQRFTLVAPTAQSDRRLHAARVGTGATKGKRLSVTVCTEQKPVDKANASGARLDVPLDVVTCVACAKVLTEAGIELKGMGE